jgi:hypothetical protein
MPNSPFAPLLANMMLVAEKTDLSVELDPQGASGRRATHKATRSADGNPPTWAALTITRTSVSLSADGNTAIVGGNDDNSGAGATWVYTRSSGLWTQQGTNLVGTVRLDKPTKAARSLCLPAGAFLWSTRGALMLAPRGRKCRNRNPDDDRPETERAVNVGIDRQSVQLPK